MLFQIIVIVALGYIAGCATVTMIGAFNLVAWANRNDRSATEHKGK